MPETCAAAFHPKVWTYATAPRKTVSSELASLAGLPVPALPFAQRPCTLPDANLYAKAGSVAGRLVRVCLRYGGVLREGPLAPSPPQRQRLLAILGSQPGCRFDK